MIWGLTMNKLDDLISEYRDLSTEYWRLKMLAETEEQYNHYDALEAYYDELIEFLISIQDGAENVLEAYQEAL